MNESLQSSASCRRIENRIPLGFDVLWDHTDQQGRIADGWEKAFEARGVNLSTGGLAMRVPFLPDVGERLACKITLPSPASQPRVIVAGTEVVWASSQGQRLGEVGLRFVDLPSEHESLLESLLRGRYRPPTPEVAMRNMPEQISVDLDGVSDAIVATIVESDDVGVTVEQPLPFLRLGAPAQLRSGDDPSRPVMLSAVDLVVEGDMPKLLLDLSYQDVTHKPGSRRVALGADVGAVAPASRVATAVHSTTPGIAAPAEDQAARILQGEPIALSPDDTIPDDSCIEMPPDVSGAAAEYEQHAAEYEQHAAEYEQHATAYEQHAAEYEQHAAEYEQHAAEYEQHAVMDPHEFEATRHVRQPSGLHALPAMADMDGEDFEASLSALRRPHPMVEQLAERLQAYWRVCLGLLRGASATARRQLVPKLQMLFGVVGTRAVQGSQRLVRTGMRLLPVQSRRRTSQFPDVRQPRAKAGKAEQTSVRKRRWVGPVVVLLGLAIAVYALWPSSDAPAPEVEQASDAQAEQLELSVADSFMEPLPEPPAPQALPDLPDLANEPAFAEPSFAEPSFAPTGEPAAIEPQAAGSVEFGADRVDSARTYRLRMSRPIERLEGSTTAQGFVVRIPGSLSLDRAGPISASHPLVRRSMILNHGDYAELTIEFGDKGVPAYRVRGVGSELELLIGTKS